MPRLRVVLAVVLFGFAHSSRASAQARQAIEASELQKVEATISYPIEMTRFAVDRWQIFLPKPPELPGQIKIKASTTPMSKPVIEKSPLARSMFLIDQVVGKSSPALARRIDVELKIEATLLSRRLVTLAEGAPQPKITPLKDAERKFYTSSTALIDHESGAFREWLEARKLKRRTGESELAFAERVLEEIRYQFEYEFDANADKRASLACARGKTDCGGMAFVFVGAMRANGIPARSLLGRYAKPRVEGSKPGDLDYDRPHVRTEFFTPELGWVPVDPNSVQADRTREVKSFIGNDPGDMLVLHVDVDLQLPFSNGVERVGFLQLGPYYHASGMGLFDGKIGPSGWKVKTSPTIK